MSITHWRAVWRAIVIALGAMAGFQPASAHASTLDFESAPPALFAPGESFADQAFRWTVHPLSPGFVSVDSALSLSLFGNAPAGNATQFLAAFNDAAITLTASAGAFWLGRFDHAFIPPVLSPGTTSPGALVVAWTDTAGRSGFSLHDFGAADTTGAWGFVAASFAAGLTGAPAAPLQSASFFACLYTTANTCEWPADNLAQFALDNVVVTPIPEPSTLALMALGLLLLAARGRRSRAAPAEHAAARSAAPSATR